MMFLMICFEFFEKKCKKCFPVISCLELAPRSSIPISEISLILPFRSINNMPLGEKLRMVLNFCSLSRKSDTAFFSAISLCFLFSFSIWRKCSSLSVSSCVFCSSLVRSAIIFSNCTCSSCLME